MKAYPKQYINGEWVKGTRSKMMTDINPFTNETIYSYRSASEADLNKAFEAAKTAQKEWEKTSPAEKQGYLEKLAQVIVEMH